MKIGGILAIEVYTLPFVGTVDWTRIASKLEKINYTGAIALETLNKGFENIEKPVEFSQIALEKAKKLLKESRAICPAFFLIRCSSSGYPFSAPIMTPFTKLPL